MGGPIADDPHPLLRLAEPVMGTVVSFAVRVDEREHEAVVAVREAVALLHDVDARFSPYRPDSEVSRVDAGTLRLDDVSDDLRVVLALSDEVARATDGYFAVWLGGHFDPSGLVKGWAVEGASDVLLRHGFAHHSVAGGGDVQVRGERAPGRPWLVGIADPHRAGAVVATLPLTEGAVATSGTAERGAHILDPHTGRTATELASVTLVGPGLTFVDAYATAAFAMGRAALRWVEGQPHLEAMAVDPDGHRSATSGWPGTAGGAA